MPNNQIDGSGIQTQSLSEILADIVNGTANTPGLKQIYGTDINIEQNTPDGQMINIFALAKKDILDLITQNYNSKDPDQAVGVALDAVCQLCGIVRQGGTYTEVMVNVTVDRPLNLNGLNTTTPFEVSDGNGNIFHLISTSSLATGSNSLAFRAANMGFIQVLANTIVIPVTRIIGVTIVNNPTTPYIIGQDQETDAQLRLRRQKTISLPAQGWLDALKAGLYTVEGLAEATVYENPDSTVDSKGVPGHSMWVIVDGGASQDVAEMIYKYRNAGCGMKGSITYNVQQIDGTFWTAYFDRAEYENLYIALYVSSLSGITVDKDALKAAIVKQYLLGIYEEADTTSIISLVHSINPDLLVTYSAVRIAGGANLDSVLPSYRNNKFVITLDTVSVLDTGDSSSSSSSSRSSSSSSSSKSSSSSSSLSFSSSSSSSSTI